MEHLLVLPSSMNRIARRAFVHIVVVVGVLACSPGLAIALEPVSLQLRWMHQFQFAGYYAALHKGYYREAGLDVTVKEGGPGADPVADVLAGKSDFGIGVSSLVIDYLKGKPVLLLGPVFQHSPNILVVHGHNRSLDNLAGAGAGKIALMKGDQDVELKAMFLNEGIALDKLQIVPVERHLEDFLDRRVEAINAYVSNEPFDLDQRELPYTILKPQTYGMDFYGDVLFTRNEMETTRPEVVAAFRAASIRGWQYAFDHPREIIDLIFEGYNSQNKTREHLAFEARELYRLVTPDVIEIGHNNPGRWQHIANTYQRFGLVKLDQPLDGFFYQHERKVDLTRFYWAFAATFVVMLLVGGVAFVIHRANRRLTQAIEEKTRAEEQIRQLAFYDPLTQLPNRRLLQDRIACTVAAMRRDGRHGALMFLDLDNFKPLNDTHGHDVGDLLLVEVARRLTDCVRDTDTVARFGGDEFVVLLGDLDADERQARAQAERIAHKVLEQLSEPYRFPHADSVDTIEHRCTASIGLALFDGASNEDETFRRADSAMYCAKESGRDRVSFDSTMADNASDTILDTIRSGAIISPDARRRQFCPGGYASFAPSR
jgi:diguanylate cyclase (GGDEF)-like protein